MEGNAIADDGITAIAAALGKSKITDLNIACCGIAKTGAKNLATALSTSQTVKILGLHDNSITVDGARLVLQSAVKYELCEFVSISDDYERDIEVQKNMTILHTRREVNKR